MAGVGWGGPTPGWGEGRGERRGLPGGVGRGSVWPGHGTLLSLRMRGVSAPRTAAAGLQNAWGRCVAAHGLGVRWPHPTLPPGHACLCRRSLTWVSGFRTSLLS